MNRHGIKTPKKEVFFLSFKGRGDVSSLDQITLPPETGLSERMYHRFGEWLKREGHDWEYSSEEALCRLAIDFYNVSRRENELPRRFDRMATREDLKSTK